ncbi:MAG TPA: 50S ribosomal protein L10 [Thermodesulfobacteriota bacterium]|nr:50S ribosomal protein L10 [Deltaproteobacteria bacterium]HNU70658.1 50S ribosomal protein L10 [Thermodesulfobacteriota bacterium]
MLRKDKDKVIAEIHDSITESRLVVLSTFEGLNVEKMTDLRTLLRKNGCTYRVVKNTLMRRAAAGTPLADLDAQFIGSSAMIFCKGEPMEPCKALKDFSRDNAAVTIKGGILDERAVSREQIDAVATLPSREVLLGKLLFLMKAPHQGLVTVLAGVPQKFVRVLEEIRKKKEVQA